MASGFGYTGGRSRCFTHWQEFAKCYAQADHPVQCVAPAEDYLECLHNTKSIARSEIIQAEFLKKAEREIKEDRKAADILADGVITGVGLISRQKSDSSGVTKDGA